MGDMLELSQFINFKRSHLLPCFGHVLNLASKDVFTSLSGFQANEQEISFEDVLHMNNHDILDYIDTQNYSIHSVEFDVIKTIKKIRKLAIDIKRSPQRNSTFAQHCSAIGKSQVRTLLADTPTRWNATYVMLERVFYVKDVSN